MSAHHTAPHVLNDPVPTSLIAQTTSEMPLPTARPPCPPKCCAARTAGRACLPRVMTPEARAADFVAIIRRTFPRWFVFRLLSCQYQSNVNAKRKGTKNEHRSIRLLEAAGYACTRAAASLGAWDIIGVGSTDFALVQVKTRDWPGSVETENLKLCPAPPILLCRLKEISRAPRASVTISARGRQSVVAYRPPITFLLSSTSGLMPA